MTDAVRFGKKRIEPGTLKRVELQAGRLPLGNPLSLPVVVVHGAEPGPRLWIDAAIHGDELNGMEIIRRVLGRLDPTTIRGTLYAVPIVNVFGFIQQTRYLPDRRDLNRCFPGSKRGSLAGRLANLFLTEIVDQCDYGIDLHTGSQHRTNLPQIRSTLEHPETRTMAEVFAAPLIYHAKTLSGSLRATAKKKGVPLIVYEGGEPLRFNSDAIEIGTNGCLRVMRHLDMWSGDIPEPTAETFESDSTKWVRATRSGVFHPEVKLGDHVEKGQSLGWISDPLSAVTRQVKSPASALVMGHTNNPLVYLGDALVHLAKKRLPTP